MPNDFFLDFPLGLSPVLILWRLIGQSFYILISENFYICSSVWHIGSLIRVLSGVHSNLFEASIGMRHFDILGSYDRRIGISSDNPLVPHQIVIDELSKV